MRLQHSEREYRVCDKNPNMLLHIIEQTVAIADALSYSKRTCMRYKSH